MNRLAATATLALGLTGQMAAAQENLTAMTSTPGVAVHLTIAHLAEVASERGIANIQITLGQTGVNATLAVAEGRTDIGICPFILPFLMSRGVGPFADMGAERGAELAENLRVLYPYSFGAYTLYGYDTAGVGGWDDLEGRRVLDGPPRGAATNEARSLIQVMTGLEAGAGFTAVESDWSQMATTITEGSVDVALLPEFIPSDRPLQALSAGRMNFYSIPIEQFESEAVQRVLTAPGSAPFTLTAEQMAALGENAHVVSEDGVFRTRGSVGGNCVNAAMDEELAYQLTRAHIETLDQIYEKALYARNVGFENLDPVASGMCGLNPVRYHPGAVRAWEEAGYDVPDCAQ
ncbi:C4-dicarboxylate ABC transporter substrate-binding protein [Pararhodobacter marinus]|uniref:C4-dicarboxylate ABC transporter substrate-binding protein n=1 Tax=Pararhodobacter marinus TaxID=2184063 RepID=A0A2U2C5G5_9RHOB|nr:TAXI family TRAP transporter solute-binding subunit [Pararhodobacter marinus]PWE27107.1 C4-dicarboxylate ABC transporter substrate-binding protein [Pararhodobacter marinus]